MRIIFHFLTTPETWPDWLAIAAVAIMTNVLAWMYIQAWDAQF